MSNKILRLSTVLCGITAAAGLLLSVVQSITVAPIAKQREHGKESALEAALPQAKSFSPVPVEEAGIIAEISKGMKGTAVAGYCFTLKPKGFGGIMTLVCGIADDGRVTDISILESGETPGLGAKASEPAFAGQFRGRRSDGALTVVKTHPENDRQIQAISGATITSRAVTDAVNEARRYWSEHFKASTGEIQAHSSAEVNAGAAGRGDDPGKSSPTEGAK